MKYNTWVVDPELNEKYASIEFPICEKILKKTNTREYNDSVSSIELKLYNANIKGHIGEIAYFRFSESAEKDFNRFINTLDNYVNFSVPNPLYVPLFGGFVDFNLLHRKIRNMAFKEINENFQKKLEKAVWIKKPIHKK